MAVIRRIVTWAFDRAEDLIERAGRPREDLYQSLRLAAQRAGELALEKAELEDIVDTLQEEKAGLARELDLLREAIVRSGSFSAVNRALDGHTQKCRCAECRAQDQGKPCHLCNDSPRPLPPGQSCPACGNRGRDLHGGSW